LKRTSEQRPLEKPSAAVKARLRANVAAAFPEKGPRPARVTLLARRIPLYQGLFAVAVAATLALAVPSILREQQHAAIGDGAAQIDSARERASAFQIY